MVMVEMFERLMRSPDLLQCIWELRVTQPFRFLDIADRIIRPMTLAQPFQHMTHLTTLHLTLDFSILSSLLISIQPYVRLRALHLNPEISYIPPSSKHDLTSFFAEQTRLQDFSFLTYHILGIPMKCLAGHLQAVRTLGTTIACFRLLLPQPSLIRLFVRRAFWSTPHYLCQGLANLQVLRVELFSTNDLKQYQHCSAALQYLECQIVRVRCPSFYLAKQKATRRKIERASSLLSFSCDRRFSSGKSRFT